MSWDLGMTSGRPRRTFLFAGVVIAFAWLTMLVSAAPAFAVGSISGKVTDSVSKAAVEEVLVCAIGEKEVEEEEEEFPFRECEETSSFGTYEISALPEDNYVVEFKAPWLGYTTEFHNNKSSFATADKIAITNAAVSGIDAELTRAAGAIGGTVRDAATSAPLANAEVCAFVASEEFGRCADTEASGAYSVLGLPAGQYYVEFFASGYNFQFYNNAVSFSEADLVTVGAAPVLGIDANMVKTPAKTPPVLTPPVTTPPVVTPAPIVVPKGKAKGKKCKKGFRPKKVKGKTRCVKIKKRKKRK